MTRADVTLRDVAAACALDVSTVSRALRGDARVAAGTVAAVREAAARLGYRPNLAARALRAGATRTVWMLVGTLAVDFERQLADHAAAAVEAEGYDLLIASHRDQPAAFERLLGRLDLGLADAALVVAPVGPMPASPTLDALLARRWPLVFLDRSPGRAQVPTVTSDNHGAARELVRRLAAAGVERLAVCLEGDNDVALARRAAALTEAARLGLAAAVAPDEAWMSAPGRLGVFATSQEQALALCARHAEALRGRTLQVAVFDRWTGEPHPAQEVLVAEQDFAGMARRAAARVLAAAADPEAWDGGIDHLPILTVHELRARF